MLEIVLTTGKINKKKRLTKMDLEAILIIIKDMHFIMSQLSSFKILWIYLSELGKYWEESNEKNRNHGS